MKVDYEPAPAPRVLAASGSVALKGTTGESSIIAAEVAWHKLQDAMDVTDLLYQTLRKYPDLDRASPEELEEFLGGSFLSPVQRDAIRRSPRKVALFHEQYSWHNVVDGSSKIFALKDYVIRDLSIPSAIKDEV